MFTTLFAAAAMALTLALPTFPDGLTIPITLFIGLVGLGGLGGFLRSSVARTQLALLVPWAFALALGVAVGTIRGNPLGQAIEDALPYVLFTLGLCAGRSVSRPLVVLWVVLVVCVADGVISLVRLPSWDIGHVRSTYNHFKVIAGHLLVGVYCAAFLARLTHSRVARGLCAAALAILLVSIVATASRGMLLGLGLGLVTALYMRRPARGILFTGAAVVLGIVFATGLMDLGTQYLRFGNQGTVDSRVDEIEECLAAFLRMPVLGAGLGAEFIIEGRHVSYVHNMVAYHLWKFGLFGSTLFALPVLSLARQALRTPHMLRATIFGGAVSVLVYVTTAASYKSYFLVPMVGMVVGASLQLTMPARMSVKIGPDAAISEAKIS
ncbi:MAG: hypothetical protein H0T76_16975 [Nannocystis sp.]|nr:O-antigen ligase family protein [Nannocystis sp.]MBA3548177.1 hypothetical protein [Nannocystis sp.]